MSKKSFQSASMYFTFLVALGIWGVLIWAHLHGGVPRHHLLADEKLPAISNWWGGLLLPLLTWFLLQRIRKNAFRKEGHRALGRTLYGFAGGGLFGVLISVLFTMGENDLAGNVLLGLFVVALFLPVYRPEYLLGFVLSMSFTFGPVLPTGIGALLVLICLVLYVAIRPAGLYVNSKLALMLSSGSPRG